jgi:hypothetical protein
VGFLVGYHIITIHLDPQDRVRAAALQSYVSSMQPFIDLHDLKKWLQFNKVGACFTATCSNIQFVGCAECCSMRLSIPL